MVNNWLIKLQFALFPPSCLLCAGTGEGARDLCADCLAALPEAEPCCPCCALPLPDGAQSLPCGRCTAHPPPFAQTLALFRYADPVDGLIQRLKFGGQLPVARLFGELLAARLAAAGLATPDAIVPVPLHPQRLRERGFNQALELARPLARRTGALLLPQAVVRTRATPAQSGLPLRARRANLRGAFAARLPAPVRHVVLLDDVVTSGATVDAVARQLVTAGCGTVTVVCVARTAAPGPR
jgi:ComF family protein